MKRINTTLLGLATLAALGLAAALAQGYTITTIDDPSAASGINDKGQVVGYYNNSNGFVDTNGAFTTLGGPGDTNTFAGGINNAGQVVGGYDDSSGGEHGFIATPEPSAFVGLGLGLLGLGALGVKAGRRTAA